MVIGAWYGNGRKAGWLSPFLLAAWDPEAEQFQSVCRCMSGFTDQFYAEVGSLKTSCWDVQKSVASAAAPTTSYAEAALAAPSCWSVEDWVACKYWPLGSSRLSYLVQHADASCMASMDRYACGHVGGRSRCPRRVYVTGLHTCWRHGALSHLAHVRGSHYCGWWR